MSSKYILWNATNRRDKYIRENYLYLCKYVLSNKTFTHIQYESTILYNLPKMIQHAKFNWTKVESKVIIIRQIKSFKFLKDLSGESESFEGVIEKKLK